MIKDLPQGQTQYEEKLQDEARSVVSMIPPNQYWHKLLNRLADRIDGLEARLWNYEHGTAGQCAKAAIDAAKQWQERVKELEAELAECKRVAEYHNNRANAAFAELLSRGAELAECRRNAGAALAEQDADYNRKTNALIARHSEQLAALNDKLREQWSEAAAHIKEMWPARDELIRERNRRFPK